MGKYQAYPEYKDSQVAWLGRIPSSWSLVDLRRGIELLTDFEANGSFADVKQNVDLDSEDKFAWYLRATDLENNCSGISERVRTCDKRAYDYLNKTRLFGGEFLIAKRGEIGKIYVVPTLTCKATLAPNLYLIRLNKKLLSKFAFYWFGSSYGKPELLLADKSTTIGALYKDDVKACKIIFPSLSEQQSIANFLDHETAKIDTLIEQQQQLIQLLKEKRQAVISYAVTKGLNPNAPMKDSGVEWLGEVPEHWDVCAIKYLSNGVFTGGTPKSELSYSDLDSDINWFGPGDFGGARQLKESNKYITLESYKRGDSKIFLKDSVLVIGIGATLGKVGYCLRNFSCNQQINVIYPNERVFCKFLALSLSTQEAQMKLSSNASTIGIMNQEKTKSILITVPSLSEQEAILNHVDFLESKYGELIELVSSQVEILQERRTALISAAVTGKIDVRNWQGK